MQIEASINNHAQLRTHSILHRQGICPQQGFRQKQMRMITKKCVPTPKQLIAYCIMVFTLSPWGKATEATAAWWSQAWHPHPTHSKPRQTTAVTWHMSPHQRGESQRETTHPKSENHQCAGYMPEYAELGRSTHQPIVNGSKEKHDPRSPTLSQ